MSEEKINPSEEKINPSEEKNIKIIHYIIAFLFVIFLEHFFEQILFIGGVILGTIAYILLVIFIYKMGTNTASIVAWAVLIAFNVGLIYAFPPLGLVLLISLVIRMNKILSIIDSHKFLIEFPKFLTIQLVALPICIALGLITSNGVSSNDIVSAIIFMYSISLICSIIYFKNVRPFAWVFVGIVSVVAISQLKQTLANGNIADTGSDVISNNISTPNVDVPIDTSSSYFSMDNTSSVAQTSPIDINGTSISNDTFSSAINSNIDTSFIDDHVVSEQVFQNDSFTQTSHTITDNMGMSQDHVVSEQVFQNDPFTQTSHTVTDNMGMSQGHVLQTSQDTMVLQDQMSQNVATAHASITGDTSITGNDGLSQGRITNEGTIQGTDSMNQGTIKDVNGTTVIKNSSEMVTERITKDGVIQDSMGRTIGHVK